MIRSAAPYGLPIVVDDGSCDGTADEARAAGADVVVHQENRGYDEALNSGFARAAALDCDFVITLDADGQHDPAVLGEFVGGVTQGADVVVGIRDRRARWAETAFALVTAGMWGIRDPLCGFKAYRMEVWRELGRFDGYGSIGTELTLFAAKTGKRIRQIPIRTKERNGAPRFGRRLEANVRILRALWLGVWRRPAR